MSPPRSESAVESPPRAVVGQMRAAVLTGPSQACLEALPISNRKWQRPCPIGRVRRMRVELAAVGRAAMV